MKFLNLTIKYDNEERKFDFYDKTLIFSDENSVGKSTLLRLIFYSLGYSIPGTYGIKFKDVDTKILFERDEDIFEVKRKNSYIEIYKNQEFIKSYSLTGNDDSWFVYIWGIDSLRVIRNILGSIYMDQDKGWTLLNRGKVIGNIRFNIRDLLIGLSKKEKSLDDSLNNLDKQKRTLKQTRQLIDLSRSSVDYENSSISSLKENDDPEINNKYNNLKLKNKVIKQELKNVRKSIYEENGLSDYLISLNIMVNVDGRNIVVDRNNLLNFKDNIDFLRQKSAILQENLERSNSQLSEIKLELEKNTSNLFSERDIVARTMNDIASINIDDSVLEARESELVDSINSLNKGIEKDFTDNNELIEETKGWINKFAKKLGVLDVVKDKQYIFTRDLKSISGTIYYKVVFSFKMAYIKTIEKYTGLVLPIVLDSPSGREVTNRNISDVIDILNQYFEDNQIIIASINRYDLKDVQEIILKNKIFEN